MPKQRIPDIHFENFAVIQLVDLFNKNKIKISTEYQRGVVWKDKQCIELIRSMLNSYSIGVLVLFVNEKDEYEILDGQQRIMSIIKYIGGKLKLEDTDVKGYSELSISDKAQFDAYSVYYLRLKIFDPDTKEEDITQTFLRLQEGTPLNKAEKINAHRGAFKELFRNTRETHKLFSLMGEDKRFRFRLLAAEMLMLELEVDFDNLSFPELTLKNFERVMKDNFQQISQRKVTSYIGNLDFLHSSLNLMLTAIELRDLISFYLLISYLRKNKADNSNLSTEFAGFAEKFMANLNSFSIYDAVPPKGSKLTRSLFKRYLQYKNDARQATSSESLKTRFSFVLSEYKRMHPFILKDKKRLHDIEQKRILFFRQRGICPYCHKKLDFRNDISAHHEIAHAAGGKTDDLKHSKLLHIRCHRILENELKKQSVS